jgi:hypothetical protein
LIGLCRANQRLQGWGALSDDDIGEACRLARQVLEAERDDAESISQAAWTLSRLAGEVATAAAALDRALVRIRGRKIKASVLPWSLRNSRTCHGCDRSTFRSRNSFAEALLASHGTALRTVTIENVWESRVEDSFTIRLWLARPSTTDLNRRAGAEVSTSGREFNDLQGFVQQRFTPTRKAAFCPGKAKSGESRTLRWRERDSNRWSLLRGSTFPDSLLRSFPVDKPGSIQAPSNARTDSSSPPRSSGE